jgi:hypothetical protein
MQMLDHIKIELSRLLRVLPRGTMSRIWNYALLT